MTTNNSGNSAYNSALSNCSKNFQNTYEELKKDAERLAEIRSDIKEERASIVAEVDKLSKEHLSPGELLALLIVKVMGSRSMDTYELQLSGQAQGLQVQKDISALTNETQSLTNGNVKGGTDGAEAIQQTKEVASQTDILQTILTSNSTVNPSLYHSWFSDVQGALGQEGCSSLSQSFASIRKDIYWKGDTLGSYYNPEVPKDYDPTKGSPQSYTSFHIVIGSLPNGVKGDFMDSYAQMQSELKLSGNPYGAQGANSTLVSSYDSVISASQTMGKAASAQIGLTTGYIKSLTTATSSFIQDLLTANRTAVNNQTR